jgi:hypothetical protein
MISPRPSAVRNWKMRKPTKGEVTITIGPEEPDYTTRHITLSQNGMSVQGMTIDGTFPDWRRVIPCGEMSGVAAQFNPKYIGDLYKASRIACRRCPPAPRHRSIMGRLPLRASRMLRPQGEDLYG